jgi:hypothetical protein
MQLLRRRIIVSNVLFAGNGRPSSPISDDMLSFDSSAGSASSKSPEYSFVASPLAREIGESAPMRGSAEGRAAFVIRACPELLASQQVDRRRRRPRSQSDENEAEYPESIAHISIERIKVTA